LGINKASKMFQIELGMKYYLMINFIIRIKAKSDEIIFEISYIGICVVVFYR